MAKRRSIEEQLLHLRSLRSRADAPEARSELFAALGDKSNLIVARAAEVIGEAKVLDAVPELEKAFHRLLRGEDKGCAAKNAIVAALHAMESRTEGVYLAGIRHVQREGWAGALGRANDAATALRGACAISLVQMGYRHALVELADLLADPEPHARSSAATALGYHATEEAAAVLRLKILSGDREPDVTADCLGALMKTHSPRKLELVAAYLDDPEDVIRTAAALAIGESRSADAFELLRERWENTFDAGKREELLLPLAMLRLPQSLEFLIEVVASKPARLATQALGAMKIYRSDSAVRERLNALVASREIPELSEAYRRAFGSSEIA